MPEFPAAALTATDLVKTYRAGRGQPPVRALDGLSVSVPPGQVLGLLGPNGAGKSTTIKILGTLARPDSGHATVAGLDVLRDPDSVRHAIGLVSQKPSADPMATAQENLILAGRVHGLTRRTARARAAELLAAFGLSDDAGRLARAYSGGMARRLDIAIGLMHRPQVLFLDEPTAGLDPEARAGMWAEITRLSAGEQVTVLLTTHYLEEADQLASQLAIVDHGRVVARGTPDELKGELHGDTVTVELESAAGAARALALLSRVAGLRDAALDGLSLRGRADSGPRAVPAVLAALEEAGVAVSAVTVARPSLDDVYLRHAGRSFEVAA